MLSVLLGLSTTSGFINCMFNAEWNMSEIDKESGPKFSFEVLIDDFFSHLNSDTTLRLVGNEKVLSIVNDFEDGNWRYSKFQSFIWDNIIETALSYKERESLANQNHSALVQAAKNLRLIDREKQDEGKGSELAEIALYGIMKHYYKSLPVVPKIFYKQNSQDNAKGADSVHIVVENGTDFSVWFGEAKFYSSIEDSRLDRIVTSVETALNSEKLKKENSIITNVSDLDYLITDSELLGSIKEALSARESIDNLKPRLHIPILLLHECGITRAATSLTDDYKNEMKEFHTKRAESYFKKQITKLSKTVFHYSQIRFHVILFPVPEKKGIVKKFLENIKHYKSQ